MSKLILHSAYRYNVDIYQHRNIDTKTFKSLLKIFKVTCYKESSRYSEHLQINAREYYGMLMFLGKEEHPLYKDLRRVYYASDIRDYFMHVFIF
jgi:dihydrodipicolinate synthase/N-acetylneuraminate lyase